MFVVQRHIKSPMAWLLMLFSSWGIAANGVVNTDDAGIAIHGYDPVDYFVRGEATPGEPAFGVEWSGATWLFDNVEYRQMFLDDPMRRGWVVFALMPPAMASSPISIRAPGVL